MENHQTLDQDDGIGGLSFRGVAVTTKTAITAKTATVAALSCTLYL